MPLFNSVSSGTWTPTLTNTTNISASTAYQGQWMRIGNVVTGSVAVDVDPTTGSVDTRLRFSLPVASTFAAFNNAAGTAVNNTIASQAGSVFARAAGVNLLELAFIADATAAINTWYLSFTYLVI